MNQRAVRFAVLGVLLTTAAGAGLFAWLQITQTAAVGRAERDLLQRLDHLDSTLASITDAQHRYAALGLSEPQAVSAATGEAFRSQMTALGPSLRSADSVAVLRELRGSAETLLSVDRRARENLRAGQTWMSVDLVFGDARDAAVAAAAQLRTLRSAEARATTEEEARLFRRSWAAVGTAAVVWILGLALLVGVPRPPLERPTTDAATVAAPPAAAVVSDQPDIDLAAVAETCTAIARATTTAGLSDLLARAASVLGAPGLVVWMGSGNELVAVLGVGYDPRVVSRLGRIRRDADNATAAAWRNGEVRTVAGDIVSRGAIVVPLFGPDGCVGVLAIEVPQGRDAHPMTRAVTIMIGAQLATVLGAWPVAAREPDDAEATAGAESALAVNLQADASVV